MWMVKYKVSVEDRRILKKNVLLITSCVVSEDENFFVTKTLASFIQKILYYIKLVV